MCWAGRAMEWLRSLSGLEADVNEDSCLIEM